MAENDNRAEWKQPGKNRFECWVKDVCVMASDHELFVKVFVEGEEVYNFEAQMEYEDPATKKYGERPMPIGFAATAKSKNLDGTQPKEHGKRRWKTVEHVEVK
jgi:hypothetical protein